MNEYIFIHGKNSSLSRAELSSIFHEEVIFQMQDFTVVRTERVTDQSFMNRLGGTIKICQMIRGNPIDAIIDGAKREKIPYAISQYGGHERLSQTLIAFKKELRKRGANARFLNKDFTNITSGQLNKSRLLEKGIDLVRCFYEGQEHWAKTIAFQDIDSYSKRDFDRPKRDMKVGMMPPKLCQIMINLAKPGEQSTVYDPFCGLGGVVMEGALMGRPVMGSDIKGRLIDSTMKNLEWLAKEWQLDTVIDDKHFFQHDATQPFPKRIPDDLVMVTETYLGPVLGQFPDASKREEIFKTLDNINRGFLTNAVELLSSGMRVVFCLPYFRSKKGAEYYPEQLISDYEALGFTRENELRSLCYERKTQVVGREVMVFRKN